MNFSFIYQFGRMLYFRILFRLYMNHLLSAQTVVLLVFYLSDQTYLIFFCSYCSRSSCSYCCWHCPSSLYHNMVMLAHDLLVMVLYILRCACFGSSPLIDKEPDVFHEVEIRLLFNIAYFCYCPLQKERFRVLDSVSLIHINSTS